MFFSVQDVSRGASYELADLCFEMWRKQREDDDFFIESLVRHLYEAEGSANKKRNTSQRPGGSNLKGRVDYGNTPWARMLRDNAEELEQPDCVAAKLFRLRFRTLPSVFEVVGVDEGLARKENFGCSGA
jgi:hypothetical protein